MGREAECRRDAAVADIAATAELVKQGRLRMVAVSSARRVPGFESVPTLAEAGLKPDQVGGFLKAEHARWGEITREIGLLPE